MMDENNSSSKKFVGSQRRKIRRFLSVGILGVVLLGLIVFSLLYGRTIYSISEVSQVILGRFVPGASFTILTLRLPRMIAAVLAGFSFGIAGYIFQTMLRNPLANPDILGISSGSSCAVVICILVFHTGQMTRSLAAVCAGLLTVIILFGLSGHKRVAATRIIVVGIGLQAFYNAIISYLTVTGDQRDLPETLRWLNGSLDSVMLAQLPFPYRFPVGVVTGLIGAPYLIWQLMVISKRGGYDE